MKKSLAQTWEEYARSSETSEANLPVARRAFYSGVQAALDFVPPSKDRSNWRIELYLYWSGEGPR